MTRHQYGISALVSQTSFGGETSGNVVKCRLFSQAGLDLTVGTLRPDRQRRQRERLKSNRFILFNQKKHLCAYSTLCCTFLCRLCSTTTWKCLIPRFMEDVNKPQKGHVIYDHHLTIRYRTFDRWRRCDNVKNISLSKTILLWLRNFFWQGYVSHRSRKTIFSIIKSSSLN